jgi:UDP-N-acetyl-D-mannosaminuronic acid dehydrogenase
VDFYKPLIKGEIFKTDAETAELTKIVENSHRAVQIAFANQIAEFAKSVNINPFTLIELANKHPRVNIAQPGIGVGGDCIPTHPHFLKIGSKLGVPSLIQLSLENNINKEQVVFHEILTKIEDLKNTLNKPAISTLILGLTYKPNVFEITNSPAIRIARQLSAEESVLIKVYDPFLSEQQITNLGFQYSNAKTEYTNFDLLVFLVAHDKFSFFKNINFKSINYFDPIGYLREDDNYIKQPSYSIC